MAATDRPSAAAAAATDDASCAVDCSAESAAAENATLLVQRTECNRHDPENMPT